MEWFTINPKGIERMRAVTQAIRSRVGTSQIAERVRALPEDELGKLLNDVLALVDEAEGILGRARNQTPTRALPRPFDQGAPAEGAPKPLPEMRTPSKGLPRPFGK
jgi:hypothetical protein